MNADQRGLLCVALLYEQGMPKALWLQDDNDSINLLSGITRRESGLFAKNTWELVMGLL